MTAATTTTTTTTITTTTTTTTMTWDEYAELGQGMRMMRDKGNHEDSED